MQLVILCHIDGRLSATMLDKLSSESVVGSFAKVWETPTFD